MYTNTKVCEIAEKWAGLIADADPTEGIKMAILVAEWEKFVAARRKNLANGSPLISSPARSVTHRHTQAQAARSLELGGRAGRHPAARLIRNTPEVDKEAIISFFTSSEDKPAVVANVLTPIGVKVVQEEPSLWNPTSPRRLNNFPDSQPSTKKIDL